MQEWAPHGGLGDDGDASPEASQVVIVSLEAFSGLAIEPEETVTIRYQ